MTPKTITWKQVRHHWEIYLFVVPTLLLVGLFEYYPASSGIFHSFFRWNGAEISEYVGLRNYLDLLKSSAFWDSFKVAFFLGAWNIVKMIPALLVAVCIHRCRSVRMQFFYRMMFVIPMVMPGLVIAFIWRTFFFEATAGFLNRFLIATHFMDVLAWLDRVCGWGGVFAGNPTPAWLGDPRLIITACIVWGFPWVGSFAVLTHLAKLQGISRDVYEAAEIDGINWWTKFTRIELPLIMGSIYLLLVFVIIDTIKDAGMILALAGMEGGPGGKATVPALFMIRKAFVDQQMGYACAVGIILTTVVMVLQKASTLLMSWRTLDARLRAAIRAAGFLGGVAAFVMADAAWPGLALMAAFFPYAEAGVVLQRLRERWGGARERGGRARERAEGAGPYGLAAASRPQLRQGAAAVPASMTEARAGGGSLLRATADQRPTIPDPNSWRRRRERLWARVLRVNKHLTICTVLVFAFLPLYLMIIVSFKTNQQYYERPAALTHPLMWHNWAAGWHTIAPAIANSMFISIVATFLALMFALCGAYFFARLRMPLAGLLWNALLALMMMPAIANLVPLFRLLRDMSLLNTLVALVLVGSAAGQTFCIFVLRNFVQDIPQDLFEAAEIDGASHFAQARTVVLPLSGPILGTVGVMLFITQWNDFVLPLIVMRDQARLPVMVQLLRLAGEYIKVWGPLMAGYAIASIPVILLFMFSMKLFVRGLTEGAVKG